MACFAGREKGMAKSSGQKLKLLYLAQLLLEETDEEHGLTIQQMIDALKGQGISAERKSIYDDLDALKSFGLDIECSHGKNWTYYIASRRFQLAELKLLVDAVQSSRFITQKKSNELIHKLETLASRWQAGGLQHQVRVAGRIKSMNESVYYTIDALHQAINSGRQISFYYFEWTVEKKQRMRHNGERYQVSPYALVWNDEYYYLVAYDSASQMLRNYRLDRMKKISLVDKKRQGQQAFEQLDPTFYTRRVFDMYSGTLKRVTLRFTNRLAGAALDRFGREVHLADRGDGSFDITVDLALSPRFYGWLLGFGEDAALVAPPEAVSAYQEFLNKTLAHYQEVEHGNQ